MQVNLMESEKEELKIFSISIDGEMRGKALYFFSSKQCYYYFFVLYYLLFPKFPGLFHIH